MKDLVNWKEDYHVKRDSKMKEGLRREVKRPNLQSYSRTSRNSLLMSYIIPIS